MEITIFGMELPKEMIPLIDYEDEAMRMMVKALMLYPRIKNDDISYGRAAMILEISKLELIKIYESLGISYFGVEWSDVEKDMETLERILGAPLQE